MRVLFLTACALTLLIGGCTSPAIEPEPLAGGISEDFLFGWARVEHAEADLDHDGIAEWFLGNPSTRGQAGMTYLVLKRRGEQWYPMGEIFLNGGAFRILPLADDGNIRLTRYYRMSGSKGYIDTMTHRDGDFVIIDRELIHPGDGGTEEGRQHLEEVFGGEHDPEERLKYTDKDGDGNST